MRKQVKNVSSTEREVKCLLTYPQQMKWWHDENSICIKNLLPFYDNIIIRMKHSTIQLGIVYDYSKCLFIFSVR